MRVSLLNSESDVIDDFEGVDELVSLVSGDVFIDGEPFGTYCAMWIYEKDEPMNMLITAFHRTGNNHVLHPALTIGVTCDTDGNLQAVDPYTLP